MLRTSFAAVALAALTPSIAAQAFSCPSSGPGARISSFDLDAITGQTQHNGLTVLNGEIFVATDPTTGPKPVYVFDFQGNLLRQFDQPPTASATANGYLDGATDGFSTLIWCHDDGVEFTDVNGNPVTTVVAANGPQTVGANPLTGQWEVGLGIVRGIAYDPAGNGGNGSILVGDFTDAIAEIDLDGNILRVYGNLLLWDVNGLALTAGGDILVNNDDNNGPILTIDRVTGFPTGFSAGLDRNGLEGAGCELIDDPNGVGTLFVTVNENTGDEVAIYQFERFAGVDESGVSLEQRVDMDAFGRGRILVAPTTTQVSFQLNAPVPAPGLMFLNFGPDVDVCANNAFIGGPFAALTDLFAATPFSNPQGAPLEIPLVANAPLTFPSTPFQSITTLSNFRAQAVVALPGIPFGFLPVVPTNEIRFDVNPNIIGITGIAEGRDTFTPEPNGFWRFTNPSTDPNKAIVELSIDLSTSTTASGQFDVDGLTGALGDFDHGNGTVGTCLNSYLGSDVSVGLIYDSQNAVSGCDPAAFTGWDGLQAATTVGNWNSVRFRFMPGMFGGGATFAFNADTDADTSSSPGTGINGASKDGVTVTVTFADGTQSVGVFVADPSAAVSTSRVTL